MNIGIIIQARLSSTRLPNKIIMNFCNGKSILDIIIEKILKSYNNLPVVIATGENLKNSRLETFSKKYGIDLFYGSENDVMYRFIKSAELKNITHIIRICSDNPFIDIELIDVLISSLERSSADYIGFKNRLGIPAIKTHLGIFSEIVSLESLKKAHSNLDLGSDHLEHVTSYIYSNPEIFNVVLLDLPKFVLFGEEIRLTVDTMDDFLLAQDIYLNVGSGRTEDLIKFIDKSGRKYIDKMVYNIKNNSK